MSNLYADINYFTPPLSVCAAFDTPTGMPYGTVNLKYGVPEKETPITCTAGVGTFIVEFGALTRLTGDPVFERVALRALDALWEVKSSIGLVCITERES